MSNPANTPAPASEGNSDPHGIDHERERRLTKVFVGLIALGFVLVLVMLSIAITLDVIIEDGLITTPPPMMEPSTAEQTGTPDTHP